MRSRVVKCASVLSMTLCGVLATSVYGEGGKRQFLNRSIYLPVHFRLCPHLKGGVLYVEDQAVAQLPTEQIFLFTYYPDLKRIEPAVTMARVEGVDPEGKPVVIHFAISPESIATGSRTISLDMAKYIKKFSYKIDVRYEKVNLRISCTGCGHPEPATGALSEEEAQKADQGAADKTTS